MTGLLNIAKCLYDAIHSLKKKAARAEANDSGGADLAASMLQVRARLPFSPLLYETKLSHSCATVPIRVRA